MTDSAALLSRELGLPLRLPFQPSHLGHAFGVLTISLRVHLHLLHLDLNLFTAALAFGELGRGTPFLMPNAE